MGYMLKHWEGLYRYLESGHVEIDNNGVENVIRPLALGRKNYLFMGSPGGADAAANIYNANSVLSIELCQSSPL